MSDDDNTKTEIESDVGHGRIEKRRGALLAPGDELVTRYRIERDIDCGGMGDVYRAYDTRLKCTVALKRIKPELLRDPQFRQRVALEVHAAAVINHPGVARATDSHDDGGEMVFIVYEFVEGETLHSLLTQRRFSIDEILSIGIEICKALEAAHTKGFIHRDLKPKNIMLTPQPDGSSGIKILDFGLAKKVKVFSQAAPTGSGGSTFVDLSGKSTAMILGTADYMSPEQAIPEPVDVRTDIYSLGLTLYEMAAGFNPFGGGDGDSARRRVLSMPAPALPQVESSDPRYAELDRILRKCLQKRPEERFPSVHELCTELAKLRDTISGASQQIIVPPPQLIPRWLALVLFTSIQFGYLAMYALAFAFLPDNPHRVPLVLQTFLQPFGLDAFIEAVLIMICAAAGVRLYLLAAIGFDYQDLGCMFYRIFPVVLILDLAWALSPLLLFHRWGFIVLLCMAALAFLPFSQRTLVFCAYERRGGRSSVARVAESGRRL